MPGWVPQGDAKVKTLLIAVKYFLVFTVVLHTLYVTGNTDDYPSPRRDRIIKEPFNFRKTRWGMSIAQVKASEIPRSDKWKLNKENSNETVVVYTGYLYNHQCLLVYGFDKNKLISGSYAFSGGGGGMEILDDLSDKYGTPVRATTTRVTWYSKDRKTVIRFIISKEAGGFFVRYLPAEADGLGSYERPDDKDDL